MTFNKVDIALPSEIKEYYATTLEEKQAELHADFKNAINAAKIHFEKVCISNNAYFEILDFKISFCSRIGRISLFIMIRILEY